MARHTALSHGLWEPLVLKSPFGICVRGWLHTGVLVSCGEMMALHFNLQLTGDPIIGMDDLLKCVHNL